MTSVRVIHLGFSSWCCKFPFWGDCFGVCSPHAQPGGAFFGLFLHPIPPGGGRWGAHSFLKCAPTFSSYSPFGVCCVHHVSRHHNDCPVLSLCLVSALCMVSFLALPRPPPSTPPLLLFLGDCEHPFSPHYRLFWFVVIHFLLGASCEGGAPQDEWWWEWGLDSVFLFWRRTSHPPSNPIGVCFDS